MRYMGIDWGSKNVGIAYSDESGRMAFPETVIPNTKTVIEHIAQLCTDEGIGTVVIGLPRTTGDRENPIVADIKEAVGALDETLPDVPVVLSFEEHTSAHVRQLSAQVPMKQQKKRVDAQAAALILQRYLDSHTT